MLAVLAVLAVLKECQLGDEQSRTLGNLVNEGRFFCCNYLCQPCCLRVSHDRAPPHKGTASAARPTARPAPRTCCNGGGAPRAVRTTARAPVRRTTARRSKRALRVPLDQRPDRRHARVAAAAEPSPRMCLAQSDSLQSRVFLDV